VVWSASPTGRAEHVGHRWLEYTGLTSEQALGLGWTAALHPDDTPSLLTALAEIIATGERGEFETRLRWHNGEYRWRRTFVFPLHDAAGVNERWCGVFTDVDRGRRGEAMLAAEKQLLELVAKGGPLRQTLDALCRQVEALANPGYSSILLVDAHRGTFRIGAAPNLPPEYWADLDDRPIEPADAPSALAVSSKAPVIIADLSQDARWATAPLPQRFMSYGLRSYWSMPILSGGGDVLGVFAAYHTQPRDPTKEERELVERFVHIAGIAIERDQAEAALKTREAELRQAHDQLIEAQKLSKTGSFLWDIERDEHHWSEELFRIVELDPSMPVSWDLARNIVCPEDRAALEAAFARGASGKAYAVDLRVRAASGLLKHLRIVARPSSYFADRPSIVGAVQDVTEAMLAEAALKTREAELSWAHDQLTEAQQLSKTGSFLVDVEKDEHIWSRELLRIFELDPSTTVSTDLVRSLVCPEDHAAMEAALASGASGKEFVLDLRVRTTSGALKHLRIVVRPSEHLAHRRAFFGAAQDVTEAKRAEAELRLAHDQLTEAQKLSKTGSAYWNVERDEHHWSEELYRIFEVDPSTPVTVNLIRDLVHPEDREALETAIALGSRGQEFSLDLRVQTASGALKHVRIVARPYDQMADGHSFVGAIQDVTEAKLTEAALKSSEAELRRACDSLAEAQRLSKTGSFITDLVADDHNWSDEAYRIFDFDPAAPVTVESIRTIVHPDDVAEFDSMIAKAVAGADVDFIFRVVTSAGVMKHVHSLGRIVERVTGRPMFIGALQDVTESKLIEEALRSSEAELRRANRWLTEAQRLSKTGSFTWDVEADEHHWSDEERRIWEFDPAARITMPMILDAVHPEDMPQVEAVIGQAIQGADGFELIFRIITQSGTLKHLHCVGHRVEQFPDRPVFLGAIQDITERKAAEAAIERARAELAHVARAATLSALTASIAHEVNQPLAGIITNASTCLRMLALDPPNVEGARATAQRTIRDGNRASEVITRLRGLFTRKAPAFEPVDLNSAAAEVLALCSAQLQSAKVVVSCAFDDELPPVSGDRVQLQQVILNFLTNAADAMKAVEDRPRNLTIGTRREAAGRVRLFVRDSGVGVDPEHVERLFDPFYTTKAEGMGVGLAVSRSIIETHEGRLWAEPNEDGPGATFAFSLTAAFALAAVAE
jgi:PAS domain S-box-containing protein